MNSVYKYFILFTSFFLPATLLQAQDTTALPGNLSNQSITITSEYTPTLKESSKINFSASENLPALPKTMLRYNVPAQPVATNYQPLTLYPLAVSIDTGTNWLNTNFVKLGYGNLSTPYAEAGFSFGDGVHNAISIYSTHTQSKGSLPFQKFGKTYAGASGVFNLQNMHNLDMGVFVERNTQYEYGFVNAQQQFSESDLLRRYFTFGANATLENKQPNAYNIDYRPAISLKTLNDNRSASEMNFRVEIPVTKKLSEELSFGLGLTADITSFKTTNTAINNSIFYIAPAIAYATDRFSISAGATPSWDGKNVYLLPQISLEVSPAQHFTFLAGWKGYYNKTTYQSLTKINPWIQHPTELLNNRVNEVYGGLKGSAGEHLTYNAKVGFQNLYNLPLFINNNTDGRTFMVVNESKLNNLYIHGEAAYTKSENFSFTAGITKNFYSALSDNRNPFGQVPLELSAALRWKLFKNIYLKSDAFFLNGISYLGHANNAVEKLPSAFDLNAGVEINLIKNIGIWFQVNNIFNNQYQRWNQYPVLGTNFLGGVILNFNGLKK